MSEDKRDAERLPILGALQAEIMVFEPMLIREISRSGATIETRFPLHLNSLHEIRLTLGDRSLVVKGRIVHSRISEVDQDIVTYRSGLEFVDVSARVTDAIAGFLDTVRTTRASQS